MIKGQPIKVRDEIERPEVNYRAISALNCSMIKLFDNDPVKFYEQFKLGKKKKDTKSTSMIIGDIVDFYILDCKGDEQEFEDRFDEKFALFEETKGSGQVFILADILLEVTQSHTDENGVITLEFEDLFSEAAKKVQAMGKYSGKNEDKILEDFIKNGKTYYQTLIDSVGKTVVEVSLLDKARSVARLLIEDPFTKDIFLDDGNIEYFPKFPVEWIYKSRSGREITCKSELDIMEIDHKHKVIYIRDLKTNYDNENFEYTYLKYRYDLQAAFYHLAIDIWKDNEGMKDYVVKPMEFIVGDTSFNNRRPVRYQTDVMDLERSLNGFTIGGRYYNGLHEIIDEICWAESNNIWNCSRLVYEKNGHLKLKLQYE